MIQSLNEMEDKLLLLLKNITLVTGPEDLRKLGMEIHVQTPEEIAMFRDALKPMYDMYVKDAGAVGQKALNLIK
jgi:TRAP-type C4-dicarboxylate transport system substrate-binding protein